MQDGRSITALRGVDTGRRFARRVEPSRGTVARLSMTEGGQLDGRYRGKCRGQGVWVHETTTTPCSLCDMREYWTHTDLRHLGLMVNGTNNSTWALQRRTSCALQLTASLVRTRGGSDSGGRVKTHCFLS